MDGKKLIDLALEIGFADAATIQTDELVFVPAFRALCEENQCGKYGVNYACPPACGTVEEMKERVLRYRQALVMQTMWDIEDPLDSAQIKPAKAQHNQMTRRLRLQPLQSLRNHRGKKLPLPKASLLLHVRLLHLCQRDDRALSYGLRLRARPHDVFQYVLF